MTATRVFLVLFSLLSLVLNIAGQICVPDALGATAVYGATTFTAAGTLAGATGVHIERATGANQGKVWVVLTTSNTVARYTSAYSLASVAAPEFTLAATNGGTPSLSGPTYITTDSAGTCYLSDTTNNRVLIYGSCYAIATTTAGPTGVLGQASLTTNTAGVTPGTTLSGPRGIGFDSTIGTPTITNPIFVVNSGFNEIIQYAAVISTTTILAASTQSYGTGTAGGGATNSDLSGAFGMAYAQAIDVMYIADTGNNRIVVVTAGRTANTATTAITFGAVGCSATLMSGPKGVSYDVTNNVLYVADTANNRVVYFTTTAGVLPAAISGQMFPFQATAPATCATSGITQNGCILPVDVDVVPVGTFAPSSAGGPTLVFSDSTNARLVKVCSGTFSGSGTISQSFQVVGVSVSLSASPGAAAGGVSTSLSASTGAAAGGVSSSLSTSFGSAAGGTSVSLSASAAGGTSSSSSISITVTVTSSFSLTVSITTSLTTSITTSITNSFTNSNSYSVSITNSVTNSYTNSVTNSNSNSYSNSYTNSHSISISRSIRLCGNVKLDGIEKCDEGTNNGKIHSCCRRNCRFKYGGHICKAPLGAQCYGKGRCDRLGKCRDLKIKAGKRCNVAGNLTGVKDGRCNVNAVCIASA